jgi:dTDP-4-dehydrorhamnose reductase
MVVNQVNATRLAMRAIRAVNPVARLVQTEDLGRTLSTPRLAYQAEHENHRRWLSLDLLTGRVDRRHPLWPHLADAVPEGELEELLADPCPPDVVGINHYLSGERFLDERVECYPGVEPGGNGRDRYVDVLALRAVERGVAGLENLLEEAWERYRLPVAVTEVHNGSSRDEQLRWLAEAWDAARRLRARGADVRAVTAWALLGSHDWDSLLTRRAGHYEPGVFDLGGTGPGRPGGAAGRPRPTALARMVRDLARTGEADHPALDGPGWWRREERLAWGPARRCCPSTLPPRGLAAFAAPARPRPLLVTGGGGALARALADVCVVRGLPHVVAPRGGLDVADPASVAAALARHRPWAVANAAGFARVDLAEAEPERCRRENVEGPPGPRPRLRRGRRPAARVLLPPRVRRGEGRALPRGGRGGAAGRLRRRQGGGRARPPRGVAAPPDVLLVRSGPFFGPWDERCLVARAARALARGRRFAAAADVTVSPSYLPDLADAALDLLVDGEKGVWHLANAGEATWAELAREAARALRLDPRLVLAVPAAELGWAARRPPRSVLRSGRGGPMPPLGAALACYAEAFRAGGPPRVPVGRLPDSLPPAGLARPPLAPSRQVPRRSRGARADARGSTALPNGRLGTRPGPGERHDPTMRHDDAARRP